MGASVMMFAVLVVCASSSSVPQGPPPTEEFTVSYFPIRGLGESVRLTLASLKKPFINDEIDREAWNKPGGLKETGIKQGYLPFGQVPALTHEHTETGTTQLVQSNAIQLYLGRKHQMYGRSMSDASRIDMVMGGVGDIKKRYSKFCYNQDAIDNEGMLKEFGVEMRTWLGYLEAMLSRNRHREPFFTRDMSVADVMVFDAVEGVVRLVPNVIDTMPKLKGLMVAMVNHPGIRAWLEDPRRKPFANGKNAAMDTAANPPACTETIVTHCFVTKEEL